MPSLGKVFGGWKFLLEWPFLLGEPPGERFSLWIIWGGCARAVGNQQITCSFIVLMHIIWGEIPQCIMWTIWQEWNLRTFEGEEHSIIELKWFFLLTLFDWMTATSGPFIPSFLELLDLCYFCLMFCFLYYTSCVPKE